MRKKILLHSQPTQTIVEDSMTRPWSPFRSTGAGFRTLTPTEAYLVGEPCHCGDCRADGGRLVKDSTPWSEYVRCPRRRSHYWDPFRNLWQDLAADGPTASAVRLAETATSPSPDRRARRSRGRGKQPQASLPDTAPSVRVAAVSVGAESGAQPEYPIQQMTVLADAIDRGYQEGVVSAGFSFRRRLLAARLWSRLWPLMRAAGRPDDDALRVVYALVAAERAGDDERPFYEELWVSQAGCALYPLPVIPPQAAGLDTHETWHPLAPLAATVLACGVPLWLSGEAGVGKTHLTRQLATHLGRPYVRVQGSRDRTVDELIGSWGFNTSQGSVFRYGVVAEAARAGALLHVDEVTALPHEVTFELHALLEGAPVVVLRNGGEVIPRHPGFRVIANDNTTGTGEAPQYVGTAATNLAFRDRWAYLRIPPLPAETQRELILAAARGGGNA